MRASKSPGVFLVVFLWTETTLCMKTHVTGAYLHLNEGGGEVLPQEHLVLELARRPGTACPPKAMQT